MTRVAMMKTMPCPAEHFEFHNAMYWKEWTIPLCTGGQLDHDTCTFSPVLW